MKNLDLELLNYVWERILSGEFEHNQADFFCGTSACLGGWIIIEKLRREGHNLDADQNLQPIDSQIFEITNRSNFWFLASEIIGLTGTEADLLFHQDADLESQEKVIQLLNSGVRLNVATSSSIPYSEFFDICFR